MQVSYGPPGQRGVTHLMAIGAAEFDDGHTHTVDRAMDDLLVGAAAVAALGFLFGNRTVRVAGAGGLVALAALRALTRKTRYVEVTRPVGH